MKKSTLVATLSAALFIPLSSTFAANVDMTPKNMSCKEFLDLNPKAMAPIAFFMLDDVTDYKGGDSVSLRESAVIAVPPMVEFCKKNQDKKVYEFKNKLQDLVAH